MNMPLALRFGAALGLGILLGLERQRTHGADVAFAGVRTFALITLLSNTLVKSGMVVSLAAPSLRRVMLPLAGLVLATGVAAAFIVG